MNAQRVNWTEQEKTKVTSKMVEILSDPKNIRITVPDLWREAQAAVGLASERRRAFSYSTALPLVKVARTVVTRDSAAQSAVKAPEPPAPAPAPDGAGGAPPESLDPLRQVVERFARAMVEAISERVAAQVTNSVCNPVNGAISSLEAEIAKARAPSSAPLVRKKKVVVVGPLPSQAAMLHKEFAAALDLRIPDKDATPPQQIAQMCRGAELSIGWIDFLPHVIETAMKQANGRAYEPLRGGMDALRDRLTRLYVEGR